MVVETVPFGRWGGSTWLWIGTIVTDAILESLGIMEQVWDFGPGDGGNHGPPSAGVGDLNARVIENVRPGFRAERAGVL